MQMELLVKPVEAKKTESPEPTRTGENELRVVKLTDRDDIDLEAYLTTFERLMAAYIAFLGPSGYSSWRRSSPERHSRRMQR